LLDIPFVLDKTPETKPPGYLCNRKIFDGYLQKKVREITPFDITGKFHVKEIIRENEGFILRGEKEDLKCRMIVGADGAHSTVGKILAGHSVNHKQYCLGARAYYTGVRDLHPQNFVELHFLEDFLPGYLWIFPMANGITNVGMGILHEKLKTAPESLSALLQQTIQTHPSISRRFEGATITGKIEAHGLPLGPDPKKISGDGFLLAGDAASLIDPFTGEGIGNAMVSGEIAAGMIREAFSANDFSGKFLKQYDDRIMKKLGRELKTSHRIQELASHPTLFNLVVKKANRNQELKEMFTKMYTSLDARDHLKSPGFYLKILLG
jgi:flavin-dependent dehydrogenase